MTEPGLCFGLMLQFVWLIWLFFLVWVASCCHTLLRLQLAGETWSLLDLVAVFRVDQFVFGAAGLGLELWDLL